MALEEDFARAQADVKKLKQTPTPNELLSLYALYKQATLGDVTGSRPGLLDFKGRAKYDAWSEKRGQAPEACMQAYVELVSELSARYGTAG
jgi:diazepam-binding inhibitor (GABA receptor modulating acyl-CoA-binding protein)